MKPSPISDEDVKAWGGNFRRKTIGAPRGEENRVRPVEALIGTTDLGPAVVLRIEVTEEDIEKFKEGNPAWLVFWSDHLHPFNIATME